VGRPRTWDEATMSAAIELAARGVAYRDVETRTGVPRNAISVHLRARGVVRAPVQARVGPRIADAVVRPALAALPEGSGSRTPPLRRESEYPPFAPGSGSTVSSCCTHAHRARTL